MIKTVLATTTCYQTVEELRFKLALKTIKLTRQKNYSVIIIDSSPNPDIADAFRNMDAMVFPETIRGMAASRRLACFYALNCLLFELKCQEGVVLWLEPEKRGLIRLIPLIVRPIAERQAKIVIAKRTQSSWRTYPEFQQISEQGANKAYAEATGREDYDPFFGPVAFSSESLRQAFL